MKIEVVKADYLSREHGKDIPMLLNEYALDLMGGGQALPKYVIDNLVNELSKISSAFSFIAYVDAKPAGLVNCFETFSTFACKPLMNIHDLIVLERYRGNGISTNMLRTVEEFAVIKGCCKLTLEVLSNNGAAKAAYTNFGFSGYELDPKVGEALFWEKKLNSD